MKSRLNKNAATNTEPNGLSNMFPTFGMIILQIFEFLVYFKLLLNFELLWFVNM